MFNPKRGLGPNYKAEKKVKEEQARRAAKEEARPDSIACPQAGKITHAGYPRPRKKWLTEEERQAKEARRYDRYFK